MERGRNTFSKTSRFMENFSDADSTHSAGSPRAFPLPLPPGGYPALPEPHDNGAYQHSEGSIRSGPGEYPTVPDIHFHNSDLFQNPTEGSITSRPSRGLQRSPTLPGERNPYSGNAPTIPSTVGGYSTGGPFRTVSLSEPDYPRNAGVNRNNSQGNRSHGPGSEEGETRSMSERCREGCIAGSIGFMRLGGQVLPSVGLGFLFLGLRLEYFYVPEFAEDGTHTVWKELYPSSANTTSTTTTNNNSKDPGTINWSIAWLAWGLCVLTMAYSSFAWVEFLRQFFMTKPGDERRRNWWIGRWYAAVAELGMFVLWFATSMCMTLYVLIPLTKKNHADKNHPSSWTARTPLEYKTRLTTILCWTTTIAFVASAVLACVQAWRNRSRAGFIRGPLSGGGVGGGGGRGSRGSRGERRAWRQI